MLIGQSDNPFIILLVYHMSLNNNEDGEDQSKSEAISTFR